MENRDIKIGESYLSKNDPVLARLIKKYGPCSLQPQDNYYHNLCEAIISQQISSKVADTIIQRFNSLFDEMQATPEKMMELTDEDLRGAGLSKQKITYLRDLTQKVLAGEIDLNNVDNLSNEEIEEQLVKVKGIGPWTVTMFLIFGLNRLDILPVGDLGIKRAIQNLYKLEELPGPAEIEEIAKVWHPYATIASWYLWRSLENINKK